MFGLQMLRNADFIDFPESKVTPSNYVKYQSKHTHTHKKNIIYYLERQKISKILTFKKLEPANV